MKPLILAFLMSVAFAHAQEEKPETVETLTAKAEERLFQWRTKNRKTGKLPDDAYVAEYTAAYNELATKIIQLKKDACPADNKNCVTSAQENEIQAQYRIVTGLMTAKNSWAKEGKTEAEIKTREEAYNSCVKDNKDCDKLPETDRKIAEEGRGSQKKTDDGKVSLEAATKSAEENMKKEMDDLEKAFEETHPGYKDKVMSQEVKDFLISQEKARLEKTLAMMKKLCDENPGTEVCLKEDQIAKLKDLTDGSVCSIERKFAKPELKSKPEADFAAEWDALTAPKACKTLLDKDKAPEPKKDEPVVVVEEESDEKSPRNYKPETCKWVQDLPRKVVNGPGCGGKSRSRICTGYVVCEQKTGGAKFIRMSTCGADKCGGSDEDAVRCTKDMGYYSQKPASESKLFMSPKLKKILSGASEQ
jgi:hypothetical protein